MKLRLLKLFHPAFNIYRLGGNFSMKDVSLCSIFYVDAFLQKTLDLPFGSYLQFQKTDWSINPDRLAK